jgi:CubicO group peptidase (beta-lactamase class C family)
MPLSLSSRRFLRASISAAVLAAAILAAPLAPSAQRQQPLPTASPESVGLSSPRLERLHAGMQALVDRRQVAGTVTLVARDGKVVDVHASGYQDLDGRTPMRADTIFRIASMTKPVTSVAILMLYEEGKLLLTDPVSRYIPAFRQMTVAGRGADAGTTPARRGITIRDLLTHRSGLTYGFLNNGPVGNAYRAAGVSDGLDDANVTLAENVDRLAAQPLISQPGEAWNYSLSDDVLGRVIEVVSGQPFDAFLRDRIFTPLGMTDTAFDVPASKWSRFAGLYTPDRNGGGLRIVGDEAIGNTMISAFTSYRAPKKYLSGGAGLTSTAADYARFAQMLLNGGELNGVRLLGPKTVELMTTSHTADLPSGGVMGAGMNWGFGVRMVVNLAETQTLGSTGMYGWIGIYGTTFWVDPKEHLVMVMMVQRYPGSPAGAVFEPLVYQAITRSYGEP